MCIGVKCIVSRLYCWNVYNSYVTPVCSKDGCYNNNNNNILFDQIINRR